MDDDSEKPQLTSIGWQSMSSLYGGGMQIWEASPDDPQAVAEWCRASLDAGAEGDEEREQLGPRSWVLRQRRGTTVSVRSVSVHDLAEDPPPTPPPEPPPPGTRAIVIWSKGSHSPPAPATPTPPPAAADATLLRPGRRPRRWGRRRRG